MKQKTKLKDASEKKHLRSRLEIRVHCAAQKGCKSRADCDEFG
jgi:hypothetical protein